MSKAGRALRRFIKKTVFRFAIVAIVYVCAEVLSLIAFTVMSPEPFSFWRNQRARIDIAGDVVGGRVAAQRYLARQSIHPYFGFTLDPDYADNANQYGFLGPEPSVPAFDEDPADAVSVALLGGSVANNVAAELETRLTAELPRLPRFENREVRLHNFALPAMKQPQPLLILSYFLSLEAALDVVILLDGFNEVVLTQLMAGHQLSPLLPHNWDARSAIVTDVDEAAELGRLVEAHERRARLARRFSSPLLVHSVTANTIWYFLDRRLEDQIREQRVRVHRRLSRSKHDTREWMHKGREWPLEANEATASFFARHWARCSSMMARLAEDSGAEYFHFLQPNQYVPGSKRLTPEEKAVAIERKPRYGPAVLIGYPPLRAESERLRASGQRHYDLTMIFRDVEETVYRDDCCHLNPLGDAVLADEMAKRIVAGLR